jgi:hypothetical protein
MDLECIHFDLGDLFCRRQDHLYGYDSGYLRICERAACREGTTGVISPIQGADLNGLAPFLVSFDPLGTIYEGVSFFITGGNVVAVVFMHGIVFR